MANLRNVRLSLALALVAVSAVCAAATRDLPPQPAKPGSDLTARLDEASGGMSDCWKALLQMRSCTDQFLLFFLDGHSKLVSPDCCSAIDGITHDCWPAMFPSLGFTTEEGNIIKGFCDTISAPDGSAAGSAPSPEAGAAASPTSSMVLA